MNSISVATLALFWRIQPCLWFLKFRIGDFFSMFSAPWEIYQYSSIWWFR